LIDNKYIRERKEFFSVLAAVIIIFLLYGILYAVNDWSWSDTRATEFCEEVSESWIREPANTISNLAFVFVGLYILWLAKDDPIDGPPSMSNRSWFLIMYAISCTALGVGSFAWHGFNTSWGQWLDVTGMMMYITIPVFYNFSRFFKWTEKEFCIYYFCSNIILSILLWKYELLEFLWGLSIGIWLMQELSLKYQKQPIIMFLVPTVILLVLFLYTSPGKTPSDFAKEQYEAVLLWALLALFLYNINEIKLERTHTPYFWAGFGAYIVATIIWEPSKTGGPICDALGSESLLQGHALWHLLGAVAMWCFYKYFRTEIDNY
jgi:predicted membrane channel-forming protein YqfA (hemolysin III family)